MSIIGHLVVLSSLLITLVLVAPFAQAATGLDQCGFKAIYAFGDSMVDTGNALAQFPDGPMGRYPYGVTIKRATGRFCDGYLIIDRIAKAAGLPPLNPYLNRSLDHSRGANFAVGGVGLLSKKARAKWHVQLPFSQSSVDVQLEWLDRHLNQTFNSETARRDHIKSSLFVLAGAGNDYLDLNLSSSPLPRVDQMKRMMPAVLAATVSYTKTLIVKHGAIKVVVPGIPKPGCKVSTAGSSFHDKTRTKVHWDDIIGPVAALHNRLIQRKLERLRKEFPHVQIVYADIWDATQFLFDHFWSAGIHYPDGICCGNSTVLCGNPGAPYCHKPSKYINWDGSHFTDCSYRVMANVLIPQLASGLGCGGGRANNDSSSAIVQ